MYAEKFVFENNSYRIPVYRDKLSMILNTGGSFSENKKRTKSKKIDYVL